MADLTDLQAAQTVKIAGADNTGAETNYMDVDSSGRPTVKGQLYTASGTAINFGQAVMASSIPVVISSNQSAIPISNLPTTADVNYGTVGASTLRTAAQIGNAAGAALYGAGTTTAQVLRVVLPTDQTSIPVTQSGTWTVQPGNTANSTPWLVTANQGTPNTNVNAWFARLTDGADNSQISPAGDLYVRDLMDVAGQSRAQSVTTSAAEALGAATILANRKVLSITPTNGTVYWGFSNAVTTSTGTPIFKNQTVTFAIGTNVHIYLIAGSTVDCRIAEGS